MSTDTPGGAPSPDDDDLGVEIPDDLSGLDELFGAAPVEPSPGAVAGAPHGDDGDAGDGATPAAGASGSTGIAETADVAPDDEPVIALIVTQVAGARPLAAACALAGVDADVVPSPVGALAVLRDAGNAATTAAAAGDLSRVLRLSPVILLDRRAGRISASRWLGGAQEDDLAPGLVLSGAPEVLEDLLLGGTPVAEVPGVETSVGMSRWAAMRALTGKRRTNG